MRLSESEGLNACTWKFQVQRKMQSVNGKDGEWNVRAVVRELSLFISLPNALKLYFGLSALHLEEDSSLH